ncbi:hypothetical protein K488DRAFT_57196 [Vararia minispora EC-137]|uniref:Uncharacterized protein n=1 Tax=Vararia minispora EC-137 TaxID=1314806 RepID=A0ACB8QBP6_9AGAM|nr:hypothetical protein K488DRAFT_57196 [Vararia minispora EC-137]
MFSRTAWPLLYLATLHVAGIYLFTRGFLLSRLSLATVSACDDSACTLPPTHKRAIVLIIDALRFDFLSPDPPEPHSPYHHNVITLPRELTAKYPRKSFLFHAYSDPPTTTLQRIKGIVTGSLPTFIDMGHNFGGATIDEDSLVKQFVAANKTVAFMGDDTWLTVFPGSFHPNMSYPFDSFNVEDLYTVDNGVIHHLFPLLTDHPHAHDWDLLIGHFLGVDHVGHRVGPDHPTMLTKQQVMNEVLTNVVEVLDDDTLLVVMGDHGMDRKGDHGGDGDLEVAAALWVYSKGKYLSYGDDYVPQQLLPTILFPDATVPHRFVQQIDLLPSLALLLGLPIPYNNLGTVIPELFWRDRNGKEYARALELNAQQIERYLSTYRASPSGGELDSVWGDLQAAWIKASDPRSVNKIHDLVTFTRLALETCRSLWAQFNVVLIGYGLTIIFLSIGAGWGLFRASGKRADVWAKIIFKLHMPLFIASAAGIAIAGSSFVPLQAFEVFEGVSLLQHTLFSTATAGSVAVILITGFPNFHPSLSLLPLLLHPLAFLSNSYTFWEDRAVPFFLLTNLISPLLTALYSPQKHLRRRILSFGLLYAACVRLMAASTVCREEQHPWCHMTFFSGGTVAEPPRLIVWVIVPTCLFVPWIIRRVLAISKSDQGVARLFLPYGLAPVLLAGTAYWILEWFDTAQILGDEYDLRYPRTLIAQTAMSSMLLAGGLLWQLVPACITITQEKLPPSDGEATGGVQVIIVGFANALGSPYLIFWCIALGVVWVTTQLTGQVVLGLASVALLAHLEIVDSVRDTKALLRAFDASPSAALQMLQAQRSPPVGEACIQLNELAPLALLGLHAFFATGHMSTISSIQWKTAFILTPTVTYPSSPVLVAINSFGPLFLFSLAAPLLALWNVAPLDIAKDPPASTIPAAHQNALRATLGMSSYFAVLLAGSAVGAAALRRHLMVWKVFAPRYMTGAAQMLVVDVAVVVSMWVGVRRVMEKAGTVFRGRQAGTSS